MRRVFRVSSIYPCWWQHGLIKVLFDTRGHTCNSIIYSFHQARFLRCCQDGGNLHHPQSGLALALP